MSQIRFLKRHTHDTAIFEAGDTLGVPDPVQLHDAEWLIQHGIAEWVLEPAPARPEKPKKPAPVEDGAGQDQAQEETRL